MKCAVLTILLILQNNPKTIADYFNAFPYKGDFSLEDSEQNEVTIDIPNAYIHIVRPGEEDYPFANEMQFVYFVTASKSKIFSASWIEKGPNTDQYSFGFYKYEQGKWIEVTTDVLPELPLTLFAGDSPEVDAVGNQFQLSCTLPQKGTNIVLEPYPVGETDNPFGDQENGYQKYLNLLRNRSITLKWNREKGVFEIP